MIKMISKGTQVRGSLSTHHVSRACDGGIRQPSAAPHDSSRLSVNLPLPQDILPERLLASPFQCECHPLVANLTQYVSTSATHSPESSHPVADVIGSADVYEGADSSLKERTDIVLRGEPVVVEVRPKRLADIRSAMAEVPLPRRVDAEEILRALVVEELANLPAEPDCD